MLSPRIEVIIRCIYWRNVHFLRKFRAASSASFVPKVYTRINFDDVMTCLRDNGIAKNDIMIVHSSYDALKGTGLDAEEIIDRLISLVDNQGTLVMPAIRHFEEELIGDDYLLSYIDNEMKGVTTIYDIYRTPIASGLLPFSLMRYDNAVVSEFPLNPLVAVGSHAEAMMRKNIEGELPSAHGPNSSWAYCKEHNAWNVGIGVDLKNYLTIFHVGQEQENWPVKNWYFERDFILKKGKHEKHLRIRERKHKWTKYIAESNFYNDLVKAGVLKIAIVQGVSVYMTRAKDLFDFIARHRNDTYPYYIPKKEKR